MAGKGLEAQLLDDGNELLNPPFSIDELLSVLDRVEVRLEKVHQSPCKAMVAALSPLRNALVSDKLLKHSDTDVKVSVSVCISEIMRITAPEDPYDGDKLKEIFCLFVDVFPKLTHMSSKCYSKVVSLLDTVAKFRIVAVMLDIECLDLIIEMVKLFLMITRTNNSDLVTTAMEGILTHAILESDDVPLEIVIHLLASVSKENQNLWPTSWRLGREVINNCSEKITPYILKALNNVGYSLDTYDQLVGFICENATDHMKSLDVKPPEVTNYERPAILRGKRTRWKATLPNSGTEENNDKGQPLDFPGVGGSLSLHRQQSSISSSSLSQKGSPIKLQNQQQSPEIIPANTTESNGCNGTILVQGYKVKASVAPTLKTIISKYGDVASDCRLESPSMRASLLEIICNIVLRLQKTGVPLTLPEIKLLKNEVKELEGLNLKISWLAQPMEKMSEIEKIAEMHSMLESVKENSMMVINAAKKELEGSVSELVELQKKMGEADKKISAMNLVVQKLDYAINEARDREKNWLRQLNQFL